MNRFPAPTKTYEPNPGYTPEDVVKIQLDSLQNNDILGGNHGIRNAYRFTSPVNRATTGPIDKFIDMVKNPLYHSLVGFENAEVEAKRVRNDTALLSVRLVHHRGDSLYLFALSRYNGCWMMDSVLPAG